MDENHNCEFCGVALIRGHNERRDNFIRRQTCGSEECRNKARARAMNENVKWTRELKPWPKDVWYG